MLDIKELKKEFAEAYAEEEEEVIDPKVSEEDKRLAEILAKDMADVAGDLMNECIEHFLSNRSINLEEEGRYFYSKEELAEFVQKYTAKGGNLDSLRCGIVRDDLDEWFCFEVARRKYYVAHPRLFESKWKDEYKLGGK